MKIETKIKLFTGGEIGTCTVIMDKEIETSNVKERIERIIELSIRTSIDRLILEGALAIAAKNNPKQL